jgi:hypothetical protein
MPEFRCLELTRSILPSSEAKRPELDWLFFFFLFLAQKTHVKPQNHSTPYQTTTSAWHVSSAPAAIMDIEIGKEETPDTLRGYFV